NFNLVEKLPDTPKPTETGTQATTTATATATTTPTQTPGFGAFVALAGLGAVALLVLRRN
ncbi:MAG: PGF-CTERM sorting domain-containing protein, partial [Methanocorpusculum sp.]|nr:PGF-CTERM sorting domain-containing protein [Methanocorpusculum sp.]